MKWFSNLFKRAHVHRWEGSCWNKYCHDVEQTCRCGLRRHAPTFIHYRNDDWIDGPHQKAEELRKAGFTVMSDDQVSPKPTGAAGA